jgi:protein-L-isoaspartate(D-aspartate) O-methyltransferase
MIARADFLPPRVRGQAARDAPLPIGAGQTTSQPSLVKRMIDALELKSDDRALEIGAGTGYAAAMMAQRAREVHAVERIPELAAQARATLERLGVDNVHVMQGDGSRGLPQAAPFDAILVSAAMPQVPPPLLAQLAPGGRLVVPVETGQGQRLIKITRTAAGRLQSQDLGPVRFVPLVRDRAAGMSALAAQDQYGQRP